MHGRCHVEAALAIPSHFTSTLWEVEGWAIPWVQVEGRHDYAHTGQSSPLCESNLHAMVDVTNTFSGGGESRDDTEAI